MNSAAATSRWTDAAMQKRVAQRYSAERRFRLYGLIAVALSVSFLAFLLTNMVWKGARGFVRTEARLTIDFPRSDLMLEEATLRGPQAEETVASAGLEGVLEQAAVQQFGEGAGDLFGGASVRMLGEQLIDDPNLLTRKAELWLPVSSKADVAAKGYPEVSSELLTPTMFYNHSVHDNCPMFHYWEKHEFAKKFGDPGCLFELGCLGPLSHTNCPRRQWNGGTNWCIRASAPCIGCTSDKFALYRDFPFYRKGEQQTGEFAQLRIPEQRS